MQSEQYTRQGLLNGKANIERKRKKAAVLGDDVDKKKESWANKNESEIGESERERESTHVAMICAHSA